MSPRPWLELPPELWAHVTQYCSPPTLKALALVSRTCRAEARKALYRNVSYGSGSVPHGGTRIGDLTLFRQTLLTWAGWRSAVRQVRFRWDHGNPHAWADLPHDIAAADRRRDEAIGQAAATLSESTALRRLHLSIPRLDSAVPFAVPRLDSLTVPATGCLHRDPDFPRLLKLFQIRTVEAVEIVAMLRLNRAVPADCRRPGTSNVTRLTFTDCGPVSEEVADVLRWPKDLRALRFSVGVADGLNRYAYDSGDGGLAMSKILRTVRAVEGSLQDLSVDMSHSDVFFDLEPLREEAFRSFSKLRRLDVPLAMLMRFSDEEDSPPTTRGDGERPIRTQLPFSLEELVLHVEVDLPWFRVLDDEEETFAPSAEARELFAWLSGLAEHKSTCFPHLVEVRIVRNDLDWLTPESHPYDFPLDCEHTRQLVDLLKSSGISVFFV